MSTLLTATGLVAGYSAEANVLNGVDLAVDEGEIVTVIGPNGAGKSTLMKSLCGLVRPRTGAVTFDGRDITGLDPHSVIRAGMGYVPQLSNVFRTLTVEENLEVGAVGTRRRDARVRLDAMYDLFPRLRERRRQPAGTMSGGERQMLAMARALVREPRLLLLDEPSAGLSPILVDAVFEHVRAINARGVSILMVEQNARRALGMSTRAYVLDLGRNRYEGSGPALLEDPRVVDLYLGGLPRAGGGDG
jgi:branched-chain amino acid transport system ATP-binding protein/neutral amino acid transport system ATP-binding protein